MHLLRGVALCILWCAVLMVWTPRAEAADTTITLRSVGHAPVDMTAPIGLGEAIKIALAKSDALRITQLDIETGKIDERTMWYRLFPKLNLVANYDVPVLKSGNNGTVYKDSVNVSFTTGTYDPIAAYIGHDASRVSVKLSELLHVIAIQDMLEKIGDAFIDIDTAINETAVRMQLVDVMSGLVRYTGKRYSSGSLASLDYKLAEQKLAKARMELRRAVRKREQLAMSLKQLLGLDRQENVIFKTSGAMQGFPLDEDLNQALQPQTLLRKNLSLQAQNLRARLEKYNITLAESGHIPKFSFGIRTPDPLSNQQGNLPYYASIQATMPIWAWGETLRDTDKARLTHESAQVKSKQLLIKLQQTADVLRDDLEANTEAVALAQTMEELRRLEATRKEISYNAGNAKYEDLVAAREAAINAQLDTLKAQQTVSTARLNMRTITGSLIDEYVQVNYGELEKD